LHIHRRNLVPFQISRPSFGESLVRRWFGRRLSDLEAMKVAILLLIVLRKFTNSYSTQALIDKIETLPGAENLDVKFNQFSGYLPVNGAEGKPSKYLHYWFIESLSTPSTDPIAFWTNGGPGKITTS
jgi:Serine carboxypeptidase